MPPSPENEHKKNANYARARNRDVCTITEDVFGGEFIARIGKKGHCLWRQMAD